ncbi:MAG: rhodanese-like domain-containing protein, partial [Gammaproteobacteria bacterium]|nr:rhodanese-like domain-containing protein [Gammaproteobacteria bacterium]
MRNLIFCTVLWFSCSIAAGEKPYAPASLPGATILTAEEVINLILADPDLIVIDSRKKTEYIKGHIEGAINILNTELVLEDLDLIVPDRTTALLFYCNGVRCLRSSDSITRVVGW